MITESIAWRERSAIRDHCRAGSDADRAVDLRNGEIVRAASRADGQAILVYWGKLDRKLRTVILVDTGNEFHLVANVTSDVAPDPIDPAELHAAAWRPVLFDATDLRAERARRLRNRIARLQAQRDLLDKEISALSGLAAELES